MALTTIKVTGGSAPSASQSVVSGCDLQIELNHIPEPVIYVTRSQGGMAGEEPVTTPPDRQIELTVEDQGPAIVVRK